MFTKNEIEEQLEYEKNMRRRALVAIQDAIALELKAHDKGVIFSPLSPTLTAELSERTAKVQVINKILGK